MQGVALTRSGLPSPTGRGLRALASAARLGEKGEGLRPLDVNTEAPSRPTHRPSDGPPSPNGEGWEFADGLTSNITTVLAALPKRRPNLQSLPGTGRGDRAQRGGWGSPATTER